MRASAQRILRPAELLEAQRAAVAEERRERASLWESRVAIVAGGTAVAATLASIVWLLATLNANVADLKEEIPPGAIASINTHLVAIDGRLEKLEDRK